jgi:hypothetical protein
MTSVMTPTIFMQCIPNDIHFCCLPHFRRNTMPHRQKKHIPAKHFLRYTYSIALGIEKPKFQCLANIACTEKTAEHRLHTRLKRSVNDNVRTVVGRYGIPDSGTVLLYVPSLI